MSFPTPRAAAPLAWYLLSSGAGENGFLKGCEFGKSPVALDQFLANPGPNLISLDLMEIDLQILATSW
jgi:hypothetical protein